MDDIIYTSPEEQLEKLKVQNLIIDDEDFAIKELSILGYSNLIKSYREPYIITTGKSKSYRAGVSFEQIHSLYMLDKNLRNGVMAAMLDLEEYLKEQTADVIAQAFGTHQSDYLQYRNYRNKRKRKEQFTLAGILKTMNKTLDTDKDPIHHYNTAHGIVPPWILFKSIYFSTIVNFIDQLKTKEQTELVHRLYDVEHLKITEKQAQRLMMDTLYICLEYRNAAAHGGRIYNYSSVNTLRKGEIFGAEGSFDFHGFSQLLSLLNLLKYINPISRLSNTLDEEVNRHCNQFPQDVTYLGQTLNINITQRHIVFVSERSNKYHSVPYCSGLQNAHSVEIEFAKDKGFVPCKRCIKE